jgi:WS/DGAT/MGAT family acyltransferase
MNRSRLTLGELANVWVDAPDAPFQIALAGVFDATTFQRRDGSVDVPRIQAALADRAGRVPRLQRRVVWTRFGQGRPYWIEDTTFDAQRHLASADLPEGVPFPDWCAQAIVQPLDRHLPLWRATVVSGLPGSRFGLLIVVHHAVAGGLDGIALVAALLDADPSGRLRSLPAPEHSAPGRSATAPAAAATAGAHGTLAQRLREYRRQLSDAAADFRGRAPVTSLSQPTGPARRLATVRLPLDELHEAGHGLGVTVNDLLLAAVTGGLRDLLAGRGDDLSGLALRASVPVGTRAAGQPDGMLLVGLPVGEPDPLRRLAAIHRTTRDLKARLRSGGGDVLDVLHLPLPLARLAVRGMRRIAGRGINLFVTDVPGPTEPLWLAGARLLEAVPIAPLVRGVPLGIAALSYTGTLHVSMDADAAVDDLDVLAHGLETSAGVLLDLARSGTRLPT